MNHIPGSFIRQLLLILLIGVLFIVLFWNLYFFLPALMGAYTLYVLLYRPFVFLQEKWRWPKKLAIAALLLLSFVVIMLPMFWLVKMLEEHVIALFNNSDQLFSNAQRMIQSLESKYELEMMTPDNVKTLTDWGMRTAQVFLSATVNGLGLVLAMYFLLWFMLSENKNMEQAFLDFLPLRAENEPYVQKHMNEMVWSNALGIPLMGVVQSLAALLIYWLAGIDNMWLWFAITFITGMLPVLGVALAYIPLSLILLSEGLEGKALLIFLYGVIVVGSIDNIARMWVLKKIGHTHPLITLFGVILGIKLFGFIGLIFGPIMISMLLLLLKIYQKEFNPISGPKNAPAKQL